MTQKLSAAGNGPDTQHPIASNSTNFLIPFLEVNCHNVRGVAPEGALHVEGEGVVNHEGRTAAHGNVLPAVAVLAMPDSGRRDDFARNLDDTRAPAVIVDAADKIARDKFVLTSDNELKA